MSRMLFGLWVVLAAGGVLLSVVRGEEPAAIRVDATLINDVDANVSNGTAPENAPRLEVVGSGHFALVDAGPESKYWIGLGCELATDALKSQLGLTEKQALLVTMVAESSPAKAAGFQVHDVITTVKFGDESKPLDSVATLTGMVVKAETKPLVLTVIRQGKPQDITVTPAERPQPNQDVSLLSAGTLNLAVAPPSAPANPERIQQLLRELQSVISNQPQPTTIHFTGPVVAPPVTLPPPGVPHIVVMSNPELPENVTVTITKTGKEPIQIKYQTGKNNSWGATEKEIGTLPPEGRNALQAVIATLHQGLPHAGGPAFAHPWAGTSNWPVRTVYQTETIKGQAVNSDAKVTGRVTVTAPPPVKAAASPADLAAKIELLDKQLEMLQKQQQELLTKQQESLRKKLQDLQESLDRIEKK